MFRDSADKSTKIAKLVNFINRHTNIDSQIYTYTDKASGKLTLVFSSLPKYIQANLTEFEENQYYVNFAKQLYKLFPNNMNKNLQIQLSPHEVDNIDSFINNAADLAGINLKMARNSP